MNRAGFLARLFAALAAKKPPEPEPNIVRNGLAQTQEWEDYPLYYSVTTTGGSSSTTIWVAAGDGWEHLGTHTLR